MALPSRWKDNVAFWLCGMVNNVLFVVYLSAAEDLMETKAGVILLFSVLPGLMTKIVLPFFADRLSYVFRIGLTSFSLALCCLGVALSGSTPVRLAFLGISSCSGSLGEVTFLSLTSQFDASTVGAWSSGTGFAGVSGASVYYTIRSLIGLSSRQALLLVSPLSLVMFLCYVLVLRPASQAYMKLGSNEPTADDGALEHYPGGDEGVALSASDTSPECRGQIASRRRAYFPQLVLMYMLPLMMVYFLEYVINQGVSPTLDRFADGYGSPKLMTSAEDRSKLYAAYQMSYQVGVFISRSSIELVKVPQIWIFPPLQLANMYTLLVGALFIKIPNRYFVMGVMVFEGLLGGGAYVNAFYKIRQTAPNDLRAWALGAAGIGDAAGVTLAALVSIWLECAIRLFRGETTCHAATPQPRALTQLKAHHNKTQL